MHCGSDNVAIYTNGNGNEILSILTQLLVSVCIQLMLCVITIVTMYITSVTSLYCNGSIFTVFMK